MALLKTDSLTFPALDSCLNGGHCIDGPNKIDCKCVGGFGGERCEKEEDECSSGPCRNGGSCSDYVGSYACACVEGFSGVNCEINEPDCALKLGTPFFYNLYFNLSLCSTFLNTFLKKSKK